MLSWIEANKKKIYNFGNYLVQQLHQLSINFRMPGHCCCQISLKTSQNLSIYTGCFPYLCIYLLSPSHPLSRLCFLLVPFILLQLPQFSSDGGWKSRPPLSYQPKPRANWEVRQREAFSAKHEPSTFSTSSMLFSFVSPLSSPFPLHMSLSHSSQTFAHTTLSSKKACPVSLHKSTLQVKKKKIQLNSFYFFPSIQ